ncbi:MAG: DUF411 domain-containing protein [Myxococcota bacterium]|nr:DUF411 domain-containing protein [Myxococcota bacterium]
MTSLPARLLFVLVLLVAASAAGEEGLREGASRRAPIPPDVTVYKTPTCGCCTEWARHLEAHGFPVRLRDVTDLEAVKRRLGVPDQARACHTALVGGYVVEGHVPAEDVTRLLDEAPPILGLAVPGMPRGSPGMEGPHPEAYEVRVLDDTGLGAVFSRHGP